MRAMRAIYSVVGIAAGRGATHTLHRVEQVSNTGNPGGVQEGGWMGRPSKCKVHKTKSESNIGEVAPKRYPWISMDILRYPNISGDPEMYGYLLWISKGYCLDILGYLHG